MLEFTAENIGRDAAHPERSLVGMLDARLAEAVRDIVERPLVKGARTVSAAVVLTPKYVEDGYGRLELTDIQADIDVGMKQPKVKRTVVATMVDGAPMLREVVQPGDVEGAKQGDVEEYAAETEKMVDLQARMKQRAEG